MTMTCDANADCVNTVGSYRCECKAGYSGNGTQCAGMSTMTSKFYHSVMLSDLSHCFSDINECQAPSPPCGADSLCKNTIGNFTCVCKAGLEFNNMTQSCQGEPLNY